jgi:hypothetical protein
MSAAIRPLKWILASRRGWGVALGLLVAPAVWAQGTSGRISGRVTDSSGAVLPGVTVTATESGQHFTRTTTTDPRGDYVLVGLPLGTYSVTAELNGFRKVNKSGYALVADGRLTVDFNLEVGGVTEALEVRAPGETVNTVSGEIARVVDREQVQDLALNGRNYMQLATLIPGSPVLDTNALNIMVGLGINTSINGSRGNSSLLLVDGGFNMDSGSNNSQISNVGLDFIDQVSIKTANFSAEYGRNSGAAINVITKSGSNQFHGSAYEYGRNEHLDANDFFNDAKGVSKAKLRYNDFGWSLGGPIKNDKLFFYAGEEWKKISRLSTFPLDTLPTSAMERGDFSALPTPIRDPLTGQPFPGNIIPASRITPDGRAIAAVYAGAEQVARSFTDRAVANNAFFQGDNPFDFRQDLIRLDLQQSQTQRFTLRVLLDDYDTVDPTGTFITSAIPTVPNDRKRPGRNIQLGHTWTIHSNLINEFKANTSWNSQRIPPIGDAWKRDTYGYTYPQLFPDGGPYKNSIPDTTVSGYASFFGAARSLISPTTDIQLSDNLSWIKGAHTIKTGALVVRDRKDQNGRSIYAGSVSFNPAGNPNSTGNAFADALLGNFRTYSESQLDPVGFFRFWQAEGFVSDDWRVSHRLSLEVGVRYTWHQPMYTQANNMASFDPALYDPSQAVTVTRKGTLVPNSGNPFDGMIRAGNGIPASELFRVPVGSSPSVLAVPAGAPRGFYQDHNLFAPRFSFAWTPTDDGKSAIRGGFGLFYDRPEGNLLFGGGANGTLNDPPYNLSAQYENGNLAAPGGGSVPAPAPLGAIAAVDPNLGVPREWNWSISFQRELPGGIFGEIGYIGSKGQNLLREPDINLPSLDVLAANAALPAAQRANMNFLRPYKGYSQIFQRVSDASSSYHAMQVYLAKRLGDLRWTVSYTLSRARDNASSNTAGTGGTETIDFALSRDYNYGPSDIDRPHIIVATWTWKLPFFKEEKGLGAVLGGWEVSGIARYQSGAPLTVTGNTVIGNRRADYIGGDPYLSGSNGSTTPGTLYWLNPAAFAPAPDGRLGNTTRGQFRGPSYKTIDLSFRKGVPIKGDVRLAIQADLFNVLNQTSFTTGTASSVTTNLAAGGFGTLNQAAPPRNVQLGARLSF